MSIVAHYDLDDLERKETPAPWQRTTATGYGRKLPTTLMVKLPGGKRWRRVYCCQYSNAGTCYVLRGDDWVVIS